MSDREDRKRRIEGTLYFSDLLLSDDQKTAFVENTMVIYNVCEFLKKGSSLKDTIMAAHSLIPFTGGFGQLIMTRNKHQRAKLNLNGVQKAQCF